MTIVNKLSGLIVGAALAVAATFAFAASDTPSIGGAEMTFQSDQRGIAAPSSTNEFWYAGTSGWASE